MLYYSDMEAQEPNDTSLRELKAHVKNTMIPLLIRIFELKLAAQQTPSRLQKPSSITAEEIQKELLDLRADLKLLNLWVQSAEKQIDRALSTSESQYLKLDKERVQSNPEESKSSALMRLKKWVWR